MGSQTQYKPKLKEGDRFNNLTAIRYVGHKLTSQWLFKCDCGKESIKDDIQVRSGHTKRCDRGCHRKLGTGIALKNALYEKYKRVAIQRDLDFNLTKDEFLNIINKNCEYCGIEPRNQYYKHKKDYLIYNGVDRIDNTLGYSLNNSVPCCTDCNIAKNDMSVKKFKEWIDRINNKQSNIIFNAI